LLFLPDWLNMAADKLAERRGRNATGLMEAPLMPAGMPVRDMRPPPIRQLHGPVGAAENRIEGTTMNRDHYLSKRSRPSLQRSTDRRGGPEDKAEAGIEPAQAVEPAESRVTNAEDTAKQKTRTGR